MALINEEVIKSQLQSYKDGLQKQTDDATASVQAQYTILKDQFQQATTNNQTIISPGKPQVVTQVKTNYLPYLIAGAIVLYLYSKGKL